MFSGVFLGSGQVHRWQEARGAHEKMVLMSTEEMQAWGH